MTAMMFENQSRLIERSRLARVSGQVIEVSGLILAAEGLPLPLGASCEIKRAHGDAVHAEVVGFRDGRTVLMPVTEPLGVAAGDTVTSAPSLEMLGVGDRLLGRVLDGLGRPIDGKGSLRIQSHYPVYGPAPRALSRKPIDRPLATGVRAIDAMLTLGRGQRVGLFAGSGVGKSVLMGMIARHTEADVSVLALVGERGREVRDFIRKDLGEEGLRRTVMIVSTSDESPVMRVRAGFVATTVAEYFRDRGKDVLLLMDSVTRTAMAQRQIGLAAGEPPATRGYTPSVFALLPRLLERAGQTDRGSITGIYTVLVEGDDINEPVADAARSVLDGHIWLSRALANSGHYPAVSVLESISRVMVDVVDTEHTEAARAVKRVLAVWNDIEDLVNIGAYAKGTTPEFDLAVEMKPRIDAFLRQLVDQRYTESETRTALLALHDEIKRTEARLRPPQQAEGADAADGSSQPAA
ncbi:MAG: FliI/YscN family ATPase [Phycisphaerae bacterium]